MTLCACDVMTRELLTVSPQAPLAELERLLAMERVSGAPVVEQGRVVGVVSRADVVRVLSLEQQESRLLVSFYLSPWDEDVSPVEMLGRASQMLAERLRTLKVADAMSGQVLAVEPDLPLREVARRMADEKVHRLLVIEDGALRGLISSLDVARAVAEHGLGG